jgi:hypothetical protein
VINKELASIYAHFIYTDNFLDVKNYEQPLKQLINGELLEGSILSSRSENYFYKNTELFSDSGWILNDIEKYESYFMSYKTSYSKALEPERVFSIFISLLHTKEVTNRKYIKIQEICANVGGIIKFFALFLTFINQIFSQNLMIESLMLKFLTVTNESKLMNNNINNINKQLSNNEYKNEHLKIAKTTNNNIIDNSQNQRSSFSVITRNNFIMPKLNNINPIISDKKGKKIVDLSNYKKIMYRELLCFNIFTSKNSRNNKMKVINKFKHFMVKKLDIRKLFEVYENVEILNKVIFSSKINQVKSQFIKELSIRKVEYGNLNKLSEKINLDQIINDHKANKIEVSEFDSKLLNLI